ALAADYKAKSDAVSARNIYDALRPALGAPYEGTYRNWLGNLYYYLDENDQATVEYKRATEAAPREALFHKNLAEAYKTLERYEEAASEYSAALELDGDQVAYDRDMSLLLNA